MSTIAIIIGGFVTFVLAAPAMRGSFMRAWLLLALTVVPGFILGITGEPRIYLLPTFILATIVLARAMVQMIGMANTTPRAAINTSNPASTDHWATTA